MARLAEALEWEAARPSHKGWLCGAMSHPVYSKNKNNCCTSARRSHLMDDYRVLKAIKTTAHE